MKHYDSAYLFDSEAAEKLELLDCIYNNFSPIGGHPGPYTMAIQESKYQGVNTYDRALNKGFADLQGSEA